MKKSTFFADFKAFIMKGNIIDMAVGVIIGGAFGKIVTALVDNIIMPLVSLVLGKINISDLKVIFVDAVLNDAGEIVTPEVAFAYGAFIQAIIDFLIIALCIFVVLRIITKAQKKIEEAKAKKNPKVEEAPAEPVDTELSLLKEIRDMMKKDEEK